LGQLKVAKSYYQAAQEKYRYSETALTSLASIYLKQRDYRSALTYLVAASKMGGTWAIRMLGDAHAEGKYGSPVNIKAGIWWYQQAAYFLDDSVVFLLGNMYEKGLGVEPDAKLAVEYYELGVNLENVMCKNNLALMLWYGNGTAIDKERAAALWVQVDKEGDWHGKDNLEYFYSPLERLKIALDYGLGWWVLWPAVGVWVVLLGFVLLLAININRKIETDWQRTGQMDKPKK
ncbi:MAG: tetratricopeptide repeat protein, partial [Sedimenticola sp.]